MVSKIEEAKSITKVFTISRPSRPRDTERSMVE